MTAPSSDNVESHHALHKDRVHDQFDQTADAYCRTRKTDPFFEVQKKIVLGMLNQGGCRILDVGCGPGVMVPDLLKRDFEVWGIDLSEEMIRNANAVLPDDASRDRIHLDVGDVEDLQFPDQFFDAVICMGVFEYLSSYDKAIEEIHRVLKPGGMAVITIPTRICPYEIVAQTVAPLYRFAKRLLRRSRGGAGGRTNRCFPWRLGRQLKAGGLIKTARAHCNFVFFPLLEVLPRFSAILNRCLMPLSRVPLLNWAGRQYIVRCRCCGQDDAAGTA